jgi:hypothetical protein
MKQKQPRVQAKPERSRDAPRTSLVLLWDWRASNQHLFPSDTSLRWHLRQHRNAYVKAGALLTIGGRFFVDPPRFEQTLRLVGAEAAS